jgi:hypothetical protein
MHVELQVFVDEVFSDEVFSNTKCSKDNEVSLKTRTLSVIIEWRTCVWYAVHLSCSSGFLTIFTYLVSKTVLSLHILGPLYCGKYKE